MLFFSPSLSTQGELNNNATKRQLFPENQPPTEITVCDQTNESISPTVASSGGGDYSQAMTRDSAQLSTGGDDDDSLVDGFSGSTSHPMTSMGSRRSSPSDGTTSSSRNSSSSYSSSAGSGATSSSGGDEDSDEEKVRMLHFCNQVSFKQSLTIYLSSITCSYQRNPGIGWLVRLSNHCLVKLLVAPTRQISPNS